MTYNEAGKKAVDKYRTKFDIVQFRLKRGERQIVADHAEKQGESMNTFINRAIKETMERDDQQNMHSCNNPDKNNISQIPE